MLGHSFLVVASHRGLRSDGRLDRHYAVLAVPNKAEVFVLRGIVAEHFDMLFEGFRFLGKTAFN